MAEEPVAEAEMAETSESGFDFFEEPAATEPAIEVPAAAPVEPVAEEPEAEAAAAETSESGVDFFAEPAADELVAEQPEAEVEAAETSESGFDVFRGAGRRNRLRASRQPPMSPRPNSNPSKSLKPAFMPPKKRRQRRRTNNRPRTLPRATWS